MYLDGHISVIIGGKKLDTITEVEMQNDSAQLGANCEITVPLTCRIQNEGQYLIDNVRNLFKSGDTVFIEAWYTGYDRQTIFEGFVLDFLEGTPLKIRCLDYVYKLRLGVKKLYYKSAKIKKVIDDILQGTGITLMQPYLDFAIENLSFPNMSPAACLEYIKKELSLTMTLIGNQLYMNLASNTLETVKLKTDVNVIDCKMQKPDAAFQKFKIKAWIKKQNGTKEAVEVGDADGELREIKLFCVPSQTAKGKEKKNYHTKLIDNALEQVKLGHYNGKIETLLYPVIDLFWAIDYTDVRYPARDGIYVVRSVDFIANKDGFHRESTVAFLRSK
jgi:hypothetical protein